MFKTGMQKIGGRKVGTKNKTVTRMKRIMQRVVLGYLVDGDLEEDLKDLAPLERQKAMREWAAMVIPKETIGALDLTVDKSPVVWQEELTHEPEQTAKS